MICDGGEKYVVLTLDIPGHWLIKPFSLTMYSIQTKSISFANNNNTAICPRHKL